MRRATPGGLAPAALLLALPLPSLGQGQEEGPAPTAESDPDGEPDAGGEPGTDPTGGSDPRGEGEPTTAEGAGRHGPDPEPWLTMGRDGSVVLAPRGVWVSRLTGDVRAARDGRSGTPLDLEDRQGLGLDTDLLASPHLDMELPGELFGRPFLVNLEFWRLTYDGAMRRSTEFRFNRTVFEADRVYETHLTLLAFELRLRLVLFEDVLLDGLSLAPVVAGKGMLHDIEIDDPFEGRPGDEKTVTAVWPAGGLRIAYRPVWWFEVFVDAVGVHMSAKERFELSIGYVEARGGLLLKASRTWGVVLDYSLTRIDLERGRTSSGLSRIDTLGFGPAAAFYVKF